MKDNEIKSLKSVDGGVEVFWFKNDKSGFTAILQERHGSNYFYQREEQFSTSKAAENWGKKQIQKYTHC